MIQLLLSFILLSIFSIGCSSIPNTTPESRQSTVSPPVSAITTCTYHYDGQYALPDPKCTPGSTDTSVTQENINQTICVSGYTTKIRPPVSFTEPLKIRLMSAYNDVGPASNWELDHRVPLEVAGNPRLTTNLWPEGYERLNQASKNYGSESKDQLENFVKKQICSGIMTLAEGQAIFLGDFFAWRDQHPNPGL